MGDSVAIRITVNGEERTISSDSSSPLLWVLRDELQLTGTKYGCGQALCGACTVHIDGSPTRSCQVPISAVDGKTVTTIEQVATDNPDIVDAWVQGNVAQCGYCQSGQIMSAAALLDSNSSPTDDEVNSSMAGNICRCGTYERIRHAIHSVAESRR